MFNSEIIKSFKDNYTATGAGCWQWQGDVGSDGYARFSVATHVITKKFLAHRVSYELWHGVGLQDAQCVHSCRNRGCVNPSHLSAVD